LKKYIEHLSELANIKLFIVRYLVNIIILFEILYLPFVLSRDFYIQIELLKNILLFIPIILLGINSGYLNIYYRKNIDNREELVYIGLILSLIAGIIIYFINYNVIFSVAIFSYIFIISIEKILIVDGHLILSSIYKSIFSIILIALITFLNNINDIQSIYSFSIIIGSVLWFILIIKNYNISSTVFSKNYNFFLKLISKFNTLLKEGFYIAMQSFVLIAFFLFDRWYFMSYYSDKIGEYSISFSFAQIVFIALNTIAFSMQRQLGENLHTYTKNKINKLLKINIIFFIFLALITIFLVYISIYAELFSKYGNFIYSFIIIVFCYGFYYLFSTYNVIALYKGMTRKFLLFISIAFILNVTISYVLRDLEFSYYFLLIKSGFILMLLSLVCYSYVLKVLKYDK